MYDVYRELLFPHASEASHLNYKLSIHITPVVPFPFARPIELEARSLTTNT